jgi:hypothetical protein
MNKFQYTNEFRRTSKDSVWARALEVNKNFQMWNNILCKRRLTNYYHFQRRENDRPENDPENVMQYAPRGSKFNSRGNLIIRQFETDATLMPNFIGRESH